MQKYYIDPVTNQYTLTQHGEDVYNKAKEIRASIPVEVRDILNEQLTYQFDASIGKYVNGNGDKIDGGSEGTNKVIKHNEEVAEFAPGGEVKKLKDKAKEKVYGAVLNKKKFKPMDPGLKKQLKEIGFEYSEKLFENIPPLKKEIGNKDPKTKENIKILQQNHEAKNYVWKKVRENRARGKKDYEDFSTSDIVVAEEKRKDFKKIKAVEEVKGVVVPEKAIPEIVLHVPEKSIEDIITDAAENRKVAERRASIKEYGSSGLGKLKLQMDGLDD
jgi:hypothetical protein